MYSAMDSTGWVFPRQIHVAESTALMLDCGGLWFRSARGRKKVLTSTPSARMLELLSSAAE